MKTWKKYREEFEMKKYVRKQIGVSSIYCVISLFLTFRTLGEYV